MELRDHKCCSFAFVLFGLFDQSSCEDGDCDGQCGLTDVSLCVRACVCVCFTALISFILVNPSDFRHGETDSLLGSLLCLYRSIEPEIKKERHR